MSVKPPLFGADLTWRPVPVPLAQLACVASPHELAKFPGQILDGVEVPDPQDLLLDRADQPLGHAISLRLPHERRRTLDAEEAYFALEVRSGVVRAVVVPQDETFRAAGVETSEVPCGGLAHRFQRRPAVWAAIDMEAEDFGGAVVDDEEEVDAALVSHRLGHVRSPDCVHKIRHDGAVVVALGACPPPVRSLQAVFRNDPPHAPLGSADTPHPQACMDLPIALAAEMGAIADVADVREQVRVAARSLRHPAACGRPPAADAADSPFSSGGCGSGGAWRWECAASFRRNPLGECPDRC